MRYLLFTVFSITILASCASAPPRNINDVCAIFYQDEDWFEAAEEATQRWGTPVHVTMAIMHQESSFRANARPPRTKILWFIPGPRPSSAYGYAQASDEAWSDYIRDTGFSGADRDDFDDAIDFVAWYVNKSYAALGISKWDAYSQYLAYHEGRGGYQRRSYQKKRWLLGVAKKVEQRAKRYSAQYQQCKSDLAQRQRWWF